MNSVQIMRLSLSLLSGEPEDRVRSGFRYIVVILVPDLLLICPISIGPTS